MWERAWPVAALAAVGLFVHLGELDGRVPFWRDVHLANLPFHEYLGGLLRRGELPQWWPWDAGGSPLLATPPAEVFHPSVVLYALLTPLRAIVVHGLTATILAMLGAYALSRRLGHSRIAAFTAGLVFGANGYLSALDEQTFMLTAAATMPWYAWSLIEGRRRGGPWLVVPSIVFALQLLAGDPQAAILSAIFGAVVLVAHGFDRTSVGLAAASPLVAAGLSALQLLPALELIPASQRALAPAVADRWPLEPRHLLGMVIPVRHDPFEFISSTYVGLPALMLVVASLVALRRRPVVAALWVVVVASALLAMGNGYGMTTVLRAVVPLWSKLRYPIKSVELTMLALAILAGEGVMQLAGRRRRRAVSIASAGALVLGAIVAASGPGLPLVVIATLLGAGVVVLAAGRTAWASGSIACVLVASIAANAHQSIPTISERYYDEPPLAPALRGLGVGLEGAAFDRLDDTRWPLAWRPFLSPAAVGGQASLLGARWGLPALAPYSLGVSGRLVDLYTHAKAGGLDFAGKRRVYGIFGARYLVLPPALVPPGEHVLAREERFGFSVVETPGARPRAFVVPCARRVERGGGAERALLDPAFDPAREVLLEEVDVPSCIGPVEASSQVRVTRPRNDALSIEVASASGGWLVLNEAWFPGWTATVDGVARPVHVANVAMRAVAVEPGSHVVQFSYATPGLGRGALVSLVSVLLVGAAAGALRGRAHRRCSAVS